MLGVGFAHGFRIAFRMDGFADGSTTVLADLPVCIVVGSPAFCNIIMCTFCIVVAELQTLVVCIAPVFRKVFALYAEVVVATHCRGVGIAAFCAEFAIVAAVHAFEAIATLLADEVVAVFELIFRTVAVLAMVSASLAFAAELANLVWLEAIATVRTKMLFPFVAFRTDFVDAMVAVHTVLAITAELAFCIVGTLLTFRTDVVVVFARPDAIAMRATCIFRMSQATTLAKAAIIAELLTFAFHTATTLFAKPHIVFAAKVTMFATTPAPIYLIAITEAEVAFRAMVPFVVASLAKAAVGADFIIASKAVLAMFSIFSNALVAQLMFFAATIEKVCIIAIYSEALATILADQFYAICAMLPRSTTFTFRSCLKIKMEIAKPTV